jgi:aerobic C4-dicarboxylate transport protein
MYASSDTLAAKKPIHLSLTFQLAVGLILGATVGLLWPQFGAELNPLATGFVKLIRMVAGLMVFLTIVTGFAQMNRSSGLGRLGITTIVYFEVVSTLALVLGLSLGNYSNQARVSPFLQMEPLPSQGSPKVVDHFRPSISC